MEGYGLYRVCVKRADGTVFATYYTQSYTLLGAIDEVWPNGYQGVSLGIASIDVKLVKLG